MQRILGIDCSSTTIGWCVLEVDGESIKYIDSYYFKPTKKGNIVERLFDTRNKLKKIIKDHNPNIIAIEEIIQFMKGASTAKTIIALTAFNRMACLLSYDCLNISPNLINVMSIRHGLKINNIFPKKEDMPELVSKHLGITFPYEKNKKGKLKIENYDRADGIAVALYQAFVLTGKTNKTKKGKKKKNESK
jgi:Holliday junction resolvasome RuvABC endonuclease subunit